MRARLIKEESGFTLPEVLVAMVLMITVMFALYAIFDMSLRVFSFGNDKVEATETARVGLARMEREIRATFPEDRANDQDTILYSGTDTDTIVIRNDFDGDELGESSEEIRYELDGNVLERILNGNSAAVVENATNLNFDYQRSDGTSLDLSTDPLSEAKIVAITLTVEVDGRDQTLSTDVSLRNRIQ